MARKPTLHAMRLLQPLLQIALQEDLGSGDITSRALIEKTTHVRAAVIAKSSGIIAGTSAARAAFRLVSPTIRCRIVRRDGRPVHRGQTILAVDGPAGPVLAGERMALNLLGHLSGIATLTAQYVRAVRGTRARILDTRKTLPGMRELEKAAVRSGGGHNHRMRLDDAVLIKTNHLRVIRHRPSAVSEVIQGAVEQAQRAVRGKPVEIEVSTVREFRAALKAGADVIMLDNWPLARIRHAVRVVKTSRRDPHPTPLVEVSGRVTLDNVRAIAKTGVDRIAVGRLTHSAPSLDVALRVIHSDKPQGVRSIH